MNAPLRAVREIREGLTVWRERGSGHGWLDGGYYEVLECGHAYVPFLNNRMGGQEEPSRPGERRRCEACAEALPPPDWEALDATLDAARDRFVAQHGGLSLKVPIHADGRPGRRTLWWWQQLTVPERRLLCAAFSIKPLSVAGPR